MHVEKERIIAVDVATADFEELRTKGYEPIEDERMAEVADAMLKEAPLLEQFEDGEEGVPLKGLGKTTLGRYAANKRKKKRKDQGKARRKNRRK
jgi:hypothetical protein